MIKNLKQLCLATVSLTMLVACQNTSQTQVSANSVQEVAQFTNNDELIKPVVDEWIFMGTALGQRYTEEDFDTNEPGTFQVVHMEPQAYAYFLEHGEYANGSMFSLSFYGVEEKNSPQLSGFSQQDLEAFEIHLLDSNKFVDDRAFYLFANNSNSAGMVPPGNECVQCHNQHGQFNGTFTQFYPIMRPHITNL